MKFKLLAIVLNAILINKSVCDSISDTKCVEYSRIQTSAQKPYPHIVWLRLQTGDGIRADCVGTLISDQFVLTHATCVKHDGIVAQKSRVFFSFDEFYGIREIFQHPYYYGDSIYFSNALIKLDRKVPLDAFHRPACIWTNIFYNGTKGLQVNWLGKNEWSDRYELPEVEVFDDDRCHGYHPGVNISHVCNSPIEKKFNSFQPTSGSALQVHHENNYHVIGLQSYYFANTDPVVLVSSRTSMYKGWIEDIVWPVENALPQLCGEIKVKIKGFVTLGMPTFAGEFPWHTAINLRENFQVKKYICGGSIITTKAVITAAHCVVSEEGDIIPERLTVEVAKHRLDLTTPDSREIQVFHVIRHEKFTRQYLEYDVAILKLKALLEFNEKVQPICLTRDLSRFGTNEDQVGIVPGWGLDETSKPSNYLQKAGLLVRDNTDCRDSNRDFFPNFLNENNFCAGYRNGTSVCEGDSGGGFSVKIDQKSYLRGLVSLGKAISDIDARCDITELVIFTDVVKLYDWIISKL